MTISEVSPLSTGILPSTSMPLASSAVSFNPFMPGLNFTLNNRDHRKIMVIDGLVGFTGGYNMANEYFNLTHPYGYWKDTGVQITRAGSAEPDGNFSGKLERGQGQRYR